MSRVDKEFMSDGAIAYPLSVVSMRNVYQRSNCVQQFNHSSSTMQPSVLRYRIVEFESVKLKLAKLINCNLANSA